MKSILIIVGVVGAALLCFVVYMGVSSLMSPPPPVPVATTGTAPAAFPPTQPAAPTNSAALVFPPTQTAATTSPAPSSFSPTPSVSPSASVTPGVSASAAAPDHPAAIPTPTKVFDDKTTATLKQVAPFIREGKFDDALAVLNPAIEADPGNVALYSARGYVYAQKGNYDLERQDLQKAVQFGDQGPVVKFNMAEIDFVRRNYDAARTGFLALEKDSDWGDLAAYKVFLCDLLSGHDEQAGRELDVFNLAGANASYYFANIASNIYHQKPEEARPYLKSALRIYSPGKVALYSSSLKDLGYLPLPPAPALP